MGTLIGGTIILSEELVILNYHCGDVLLINAFL